MANILDQPLRLSDYYKEIRFCSFLLHRVYLNLIYLFIFVIYLPGQMNLCFLRLQFHHTIIIHTFMSGICPMTHQIGCNSERIWKALIMYEGWMNNIPNFQLPVFFIATLRTHLLPALALWTLFAAESSNLNIWWHWRYNLCFPSVALLKSILEVLLENVRKCGRFTSLNYPVPR